MKTRPIVFLIPLLLSVLISCLSLTAQDLPPSKAVSTSIESGSIIIPMNESLQSKSQTQWSLNYDYTGFNTASYGLVYDLLDFGLPVQWVVRAGKGKDEVDFSALAEIILPNAQASNTYNFISGAFIVKASDLVSFDNCLGQTTISPVIERIESFGNEVTVMRLLEDIVVDVMYELNSPPVIAVIDDGNSTYVHRNVLEEADIPFAEIGSNDFFNSFTCYSFISQPHLGESGYTGGASSIYIQSVETFVKEGGNFLAQCRTIETFEDPGHFQTTNGVNGSNSDWYQSNNESYKFFEHDQAPMQFEGTLPVGVHGSTSHYTLSGGSFIPNSYVGLTNQDDQLIFSSADLNGSISGGNVFYLAGHEFEGRDIPDWSGPVTPQLAAELPLNQEYKRIFLNAAFVPSTVTFACAGQDHCVCPGEPVVLGCPSINAGASFEWSPTDGLSCTNCPNPTAKVNETTTYTVSDVDGCTSSEVTIFVDAVNSATVDMIGGGAIGCGASPSGLATTVQFSESGVWDFTILLNGNLYETNQITGSDYNFFANTPGTYSIGSASLVGAQCDQAIPLQNVTVTDGALDFNYNLGPPTTICEGVPYVVGAPNLSDPNYDFEWHDGSDLSYFEITTAGTYSVMVDFGTCYDESSVEISVFPELVDPDILPEYFVCENIDLSVNAETPHATSYLWSTGETTPSIDIKQLGSYRVAISDTCSMIEASFEVIESEIEEVQPLFVPTGFSPNADNVNDIFKPLIWEGPDPTSVEFFVYDRWGTLVFQSDNIDFGWAGEKEEQVAEMGVYAWTYKLSGPSCEGEIEISNQGNVTLIR